MLIVGCRIPFCVSLHYYMQCVTYTGMSGLESNFSHSMCSRYGNIMQYLLYLFNKRCIDEFFVIEQDNTVYTFTWIMALNSKRKIEERFPRHFGRHVGEVKKMVWENIRIFWMNSVYSEAGLFLYFFHLSTIFFWNALIRLHRFALALRVFCSCRWTIRWLWTTCPCVEHHDTATRKESGWMDSTMSQDDDMI